MVRDCTDEGVDVLLSVNMGGRAEVIFIKSMETGAGGGGCNFPRWRFNINELRVVHAFACALLRTD